MKLLTGILSVLLLVSLWFNFQLSKKGLKEESKINQEKPQSDTTPNLQLLQVIHLDDPIPTLERFYNLFPGTELDQLFVGNINPDSDAAAQITKALGIPLISGKAPFPRTKIDSFVRNSPNGNFLHFANLKIGDNALGFGSTKTTPCPFPKVLDGQPEIGQVIPWVKVKTNAQQDFDKAAELGFEKCDTFISNRNEGYLIDPAGFLLLIQGTSPSK